MIETLLGMWTCGLLAAALVLPQRKVHWTFWRFTVLLALAASAAVAAFAWFTAAPVAGGRAAMLAAGGAMLIAGGAWLASLLSTAGAPLDPLRGRIGPALALGFGLFVTYGFATAAGVLARPPRLWSVLALTASAAVVGLGTMAAMLGHAYLTAKAMPIDPLRRVVSVYAAAAVLQAPPAAVIAGPYLAPLWGIGRLDAFWAAAAIMYAAMGVLASIALAVMAWQAVRVRNTQSTTGIMYFAMVLNFVGALALCMLLKGGRR